MGLLSSLGRSLHQTQDGSDVPDRRGSISRRMCVSRERQAITTALESRARPSAQVAAGAVQAKAPSEHRSQRTRTSVSEERRRQRPPGPGDAGTVTRRRSPQGGPGEGGGEHVSERTRTSVRERAEPTTHAWAAMRRPVNRRRCGSARAGTAPRSSATGRPCRSSRIPSSRRMPGRPATRPSWRRRAD
jgi:hypothetical protein